MLGLTVSTNLAAKVNALRWFGQMLKAEEDNLVRMALTLEVREKKEERAPKEIMAGKSSGSLQKSCLKEDTSNRTKWRKCVWTLKN